MSSKTYRWVGGVIDTCSQSASIMRNFAQFQILLKRNCVIIVQVKDYLVHSVIPLDWWVWTCVCPILSYLLKFVNMFLDGLIDMIRLIGRTDWHDSIGGLVHSFGIPIGKIFTKIRLDLFPPFAIEKNQLRLSILKW